MAHQDDGEFARTLERVARDMDLDDWSNPKPQIDHKLRKDVRNDAVRGGKIGPYLQALESAGLRYVPAHKLGAWNDGSLHQEGLWIHPDYELKIAFTEDDILTMFQGPAGPENLWHWVTLKVRRLAAQRAGIVLP